jgi:hypothetical protein
MYTDHDTVRLDWREGFSQLSHRVPTTRRHLQACLKALLVWHFHFYVGGLNPRDLPSNLLSKLLGSKSRNETIFSEVNALKTVQGLTKQSG